MAIKINTKEYCKEHKPRNKILGYGAHVKWMERKINQGYKQERCPVCKKWFFKCEM